MTIPDWLPAYVRGHMARIVRQDPVMRTWIQEANGITLFGSIGMEAVLRPDGSVWYYEVVDWPKDERYEWREVSGNERWTALVCRIKRFPELRELLPKRPPGTPDCRRCEGRGELYFEGQGQRYGGIACPDCGKLGWVTSAA